ncbi:hypothetical protein Clacol_009677 [Clathrus columnatus]|uniref:Uncharacterized protein n=1 Tax=Clathrus columnatus TaxID=1419009 RepID=A0AAV5AR98_9AGAM|nr:hypothetical protein Clacol_009677 [Clathrus columnatus]
MDYHAHLAGVVAKQRNTTLPVNTPILQQTPNAPNVYYVSTPSNATQRVPTHFTNTASESSKSLESNHNNMHVSTTHHAAAPAPGAAHIDITDDVNTITASSGSSLLVSQNSIMAIDRNKPWSQQKHNFNRHVTRSMQTLSFVRTRLDECSNILQTELNTWDIPNLKATFSDLRQALDRINHHSTPVSSLKQVLTTQLNGLEEQLSELCSRMETLSEKEYDTGKFILIGFSSNFLSD